jgi:hypothetical protein
MPQWRENSLEVRWVTTLLGLGELQSTERPTLSASQP